jgi:hypothetical protein
MARELGAPFSTPPALKLPSNDTQVFIALMFLLERAQAAHTVLAKANTSSSTCQGAGHPALVRHQLIVVYPSTK